MLRAQRGWAIWGVFVGAIGFVGFAGVAAYAQQEAVTPGDATTPDALPGHSFHGEVFNEGPRQAAYLLDGMGNVSFPITTSHPDAQKFFNQGVAQLHGFWYFESERSFRQVAAIDPDCAMAYWGMAMSNLGNEKRAQGFLAKAVERREKASDRERRYIDALHAYLEAGNDKKKERAEAYVTALEKLLYAYPDDVEAKAFLALQIWNNRNTGIKIQSHLAVDALMKQVLAVNPMHPVHHYRIHLWDYEKPEFALDSAALCGQSVPGIAHMWHMPGHIYSRLKRYRDACWQQEASARVDHAHMMRYRVLPDQIHNFAHNNEWLIRNLIHVGRIHDALDLAKNMIELPRHPKYNTLSRSGCSASYGRARLVDVLETFELWPDIIQLAGSPYFEPSDIEKEQVVRLRWLGAAHMRQGDFEAGHDILKQLNERIAEKQAARDQAVADATAKAKQEQKDEKETERLQNEAKRPLEGSLRELEQAVAFIEGMEAVRKEDDALALERWKKAGSVDPLQMALVQFRAGETEAALKAAKRTVDSHQNEVQPLANYIYLLWLADEKEEAKQYFEQLRAISSDIQICSPVFTRLAPIAEHFGYPADWRVPAPPADDVGIRPDLATLGPFRWQPSAAPDWHLTDAAGKLHSLKEFQGRTVVVIFYLGYGCLHCAEQLRAFAPAAQQFADAGISVVAISTDNQADLTKSLENYENGSFPYTLLTDAPLETFRSYRCYDDFEQKPLHGTFLINDQGNVIWQDISYEPFMDPQFVLGEARRQRSLRGEPTAH